VLLSLLSGAEGEFMEKFFLEGFTLQASLIFALGAQNLFVLESGLKKNNPFTVSLVCFLCDLTLILLGVAGAASIFNLLPSLKIFIGVVGVGFLFFYGLQKISETTDVATTISEKGTFNIKRSAMLALTFSVLNPHAYLDAFVLIGGYSSKYADIDHRLMLGLGAAVYSGIWFVLLSSFSGFMKPFLTNQKRMKMVSSAAGCVLLVLSGKLAIDVFAWIPSGSLYPWPPQGLTLFSSILF
jgi:L-lysine exporter family protein LysE/ArgO